MDCVARSAIATVSWSTLVTLALVTIRSIPQYFKTRDGLPDLSGHISSGVIASSNWVETKKAKKQGRWFMLFSYSLQKDLKKTAWLQNTTSVMTQNYLWSTPWLHNILVNKTMVIDFNSIWHANTEPILVSLFFWPAMSRESLTPFVIGLLSSFHCH